MKARAAWGAGLMLFLFAFDAAAVTPAQTTVADLAATLQAQRDVCAKMAADAKSTYSLAQYQSGLDRQTAAVKAEMDARVYGVGHGRQQTTDYNIQQIQNSENAQNAKDRSISDEYGASTQKVGQCVSDFEQKGKSIYVVFKQRHTNNSIRAQAESLMSAWLENMSEINTDTPNGSDTSYGAWKAAKARAEVSSL